jgi:hypothetical protein
MFLSPYETTVCKNHRTKEIERDVQDAIIAGTIVERDGVFYVTSENKHIKPFAHPLVIDRPGGRSADTSTKIVVVDARTIARTDQSGSLVGDMDFRYTEVRAKLMDKVWLQNAPLDLLNSGDLPMRVFSRMFAENMQRRMNLSLDVQLRIQIIVAYYYICLFHDKIENDEDVMLANAKRISRSTGINLPKVLEVLEHVSAPFNIEKLALMLAEHGGSVRLQNMSAAIIYTMLGGIWFGSNATENVAVALEHPPTFCAMLYSALNDRSYRKTILSEVAKHADPRNAIGDIFVKNIRNAINSTVRY